MAFPPRILKIRFLSSLSRITKIYMWNNVMVFGRHWPLVFRIGIGNLEINDQILQVLFRKLITKSDVNGFNKTRDPYGISAEVLCYADFWSSATLGQDLSRVFS